MVTVLKSIQFSIQIGLIQVGKDWTVGNVAIHVYILLL